MFIRLKKVQGKYYAYHVQNKRINGKVRQKVKSYIGKAIFANKKYNLDFLDFIKKGLDLYIDEKSYNEIVGDLIRWELAVHDLDNISFNPKRYSLTNDNNPIVIKLNDGYLYNKTINQLLKFQAVGDDEYFIGKELAENFVKAGINVPKELFVKLFEKLLSRS